MATQPVRFDPSVETIADDEAETLASLKDSFREILDTTSKDYGHAVRAVHAKAHGIVRGVFTVSEGLPPVLAQGIFATPGTHDAILRISTNAGDILDDSVSLPRGIALKILDVEGSRLPGAENATTLTLSANNIFDVVARRHASFLKDFAPLAGRDLRATLSFRL